MYSSFTISSRIVSLQFVIIAVVAVGSLAVELAECQEEYLITVVWKGWGCLSSFLVLLKRLHVQLLVWLLNRLSIFYNLC